MKKKIIIISVIILFLCGIAAGLIYRQHKYKEWATEVKLEILYKWQNKAFLMNCNHKERLGYLSADNSDLQELAIYLHIYNNMQTDYQLTIEDVLNYLSEEYDSEGNLRVYSQPKEIENYIHNYPEVDELATDFRGHFIDYMKEENHGNYWEMPYEEVVAALEEYKNSPEYVPPQEKEQTSTSDLEVTPELSNRIFNKMEDMKEAGYSQEEIDKAVKQIIEEYQNEE